jgi:phosphoribosylanthranilate isomerase
VAAVSRTRVKVCGLTRAVDARAAVRAGADALGVILAPGHRRSLTLAGAAIVFAGAPPGVRRVGVFVDAELGEVADAVARLGLAEVQLHGAEDPAYCEAVPAAAVKTFRVGAGFDPAAVRPYMGVVEAVLLDTLADNVAGGSGRAFDWELACGVADGVPVYLAGGLSADNVGEAVLRVRPAGVDVSSGVEEAPGIKSETEMVRFVEAVRGADRAGEESARE